jgi:putative inorganic carbon (HCO3(-)) transporter
MRSKPRWALLGAALGLGTAALLAILAVLAWRHEPAASKPGPYIPLAVDKSLGINADLIRLDAQQRENALAAMEAGGFGWLRQRFPWDAIEPQPGVYDWALSDQIVEDVKRHNLQLIAVLDGSPAWARADVDAENPLAPPVEARNYGHFVAAFATRYADRIDHYEIWDEPNIAPHWGAREIDPAAYARLLREGAIQVRAADPEAVVLLAALAPTVEAGGANLSDLSFLDALYRWGAAEWFDVVAAQPYTFDGTLQAKADFDKLNWQRVGLLREVMAAHDDAGTAVWAVSFGTSEVTESAVLEAVDRARADWPWLGPMLWAAWSPGGSHSQYALTNANGEPGSVYEALATRAATVGLIAWPGAYPADHPSGEYEGDWRVTSSGADIGGSGDRLTIHFQGTHLDLTVRRGDYRAFLFVTVDGEPANALPRDTEGRAYVVLYDPAGETNSVTLARDLPAGEHLAEIITDRGWGQWAIAGWTVAQEAPRPQPWLPALLGLVALAVFASTVYSLAWRGPQFALRLRRAGLWSSASRLLNRYRALDERLVLGLTAAAAILTYAMVGTLPTLAALGVLAILLLLRPEMGLPLIALALPFYQLGRPLLGKVFSMVEILTLLTAVGWLVGRLVDWKIGKLGEGRRNPQFTNSQSTSSQFTKLDWGVLALVVVGALSLLWAEHAREAAREFRTVVLEAALFYGLLRVLVRGRREVWRVVDAWLLGGALIALIGIGQWLLGANLITAEGVGRVRGFYGSPNNLALYLGRVLPLAVAMAAWGRGERRRWPYALAALLMAGALLLTYSRGAWLLGVPAALLFLAAMRGRRALVATVGALAVLAAVVLLVVGTGRLTSLLDTTEGTTSFRLQLWQSSLAMIGDHPLLGVGLDNFLYAYRSHYVLPTAWEEFNLSHPHNFVLDFWLRLGLPGLLVLGWLLGGFFRRGWRAYRRLPEGADRLLVLGLMAGMVNFVAHGLVDNAFFLVDLGFVFMLMLAVVQNNGFVE